VGTLPAFLAPEMPDSTTPSVATQAGDALTGDSPRPFTKDPVLAQAPPAVWRRWLTRAFTIARQRLAGLSLFLALALAAGAGLLWVFGALVDEVFEGETQALDTAVLRFLRDRQSPAADGIAGFFSLMGGELLALVLLVVLVWLTRTRRWGAAVSLVLVTAGAQLLNNVLKDYFQRPRPAPLSGPLAELIPAQAWSFPSGHAMVSGAFYVFLAYLSWQLLTGWKQVLVTGALVLLILGIGLSRLYLGVHFLTDVMAGYAAGAVWTESIVLAGKYLSHRRGTANSRTQAADAPLAMAQ